MGTATIDVLRKRPVSARNTTTLARRALLVVSWLLVVASSVGCEESRTRPCCPCPSSDAAPVVDTGLMAYLSMARAAHHHADLCEEKHDLACAVDALDQFITAPIPSHRGRVPIEARQVLADALARSADLESQRGGYAKASKLIERGLKFVSDGSYYQGHLLEVRGINRQRWAAALERSGDVERANELKSQARRDLTRAIRIQEQVIRRSLREDDGGVTSQ